ncbi:hypothetical protein HMPREF1516_1306 [Streptococcus sp. CM6]|uniref:Uncharacterized protein n=2 Tax=Streptococcus oralis TaxID=1303 RepID=F9Q1C5_STROR|nr:hypothetical protein HMPREF9189_0810 [Streptococcus sp. oral taxon 071 str. 73H25AP]EGL91414.1 hypothetical protein HMPREF9968_1630 [Streptococcus oralis SK255]EGV01716.1 hypothetical protein HMPREF9950_0845 [Streptococcus oralis SK313]EUC82515.1 hypothetical protein HMPREF1516_1306 [Streptococcus sp. CM6]
MKISKECEKKVVSVSFKFCLAPIYHYQVQGINFGIDVLTEVFPIIKKI